MEFLKKCGIVIMGACSIPALLVFGVAINAPEYLIPPTMLLTWVSPLTALGASAMFALDTCLRRTEISTTAHVSIDFVAGVAMSAAMFATGNVVAGAITACGVVSGISLVGDGYLFSKGNSDP